MSKDNVFPSITSEGEKEDIDYSSLEDKLGKSLDEAISQKGDKVEDVMDQYQMRHQQLRTKAMEDAQKVVLKQVLSDVVDLVEEEKKDVLKQVEDNKEELQKVETSVKETQKKLDLQTTNLGEKISEARKNLQTELEANKSRFEEENDRIDQNISDLEAQLQKVRKELKSSHEKKVGEVERKIEDKLERRVKEAERKIDSEVRELDHKIDQRIEKKIENSLNLDKEKLRRTTEKFDRLEDTIGKVEEMERELNDISNLELSDRLEEEIIEKVESHLEDKGERSEETNTQIDDSGSKKKARKGSTLNVSEINESLVGVDIRVKGRLEFRKEQAGNNFYKLSGFGESIVVKSDKRIPEGKRILNGEVKLVKGNICLVVE